MRAWTFALVPLFAALAVGLLRLLETSPGAARSQAAFEIGMTPHSPAGGPDSGRTSVAQEPTAPGLEQPKPIVDLHSLSDLERAVIEANGPDRGRMAVTLELVKSRIIALTKQARDFCQNIQRDGVAGARPDDPALAATETEVQVSAWVETGGGKFRLSKITVTPWRGAALPRSFGDCMQANALSSAATTDSEGPSDPKQPHFSGTHRMVVNLKTDCAESVWR